jgi:dTDP-4-amino-4,6-dideoxygalactose transaminase
MNLPFLDHTRKYREIRKEIDEVIQRVAASGRYIGGDEVSLFEEETARYASVRHAVGVSSGTDALLVSLMASGVQAGDEVITTPFTFIASAEVISFLGAKPVFVDIEEDTFNIDPDLIESHITERTACIIPVHIFGHMADMRRITAVARKYRLKVIEDAAQAIGATIESRQACSFGDAGCLSFFPSKNLGAFGDGGMVLTDSDEIAGVVRKLKEHGSAKRYHHSRIGINGRLDALQAAILRVKLRHLERWAQMRRAHAAAYAERLEEFVRVPVSKDGYGHVFNQYSILTQKRDELRMYLQERGVPTVVYYPIPLHFQEVFQYLGYREGDFPVSEEVSGRILSLPVFPELSQDEREYIIETILSFFTSS